MRCRASFRLFVVWVLIGVTFPVCAGEVAQHHVESLQLIYDANGNLIQRTVNGQTTRFEYDAYNRQIAVIDSLGNKRLREYDANNNLTAVVDAAGNRTEFYYNAINQLVGTRDALGNITRAQLDAENNLAILTDADGGQFQETHDGLNRLTSITNPVGKTTRYAYDLSGGISQRLNPDGTWIAYHRNAMGWLTLIEYSDGTQVLMEYDAAGNMTRVKGPHTDFIYVYDAQNRLIAVKDNVLGKTQSYGYNTRGQRQRSVDGDGNVTEYPYDAAGRLSAISHNGKIEARYEYDNFGRVVKQTLGNGVTVDQTFDTNGNLLQVVHQSAEGVLLSKSAYERNARGDIARETRSLRTPEGQLETSIIDYQYDAIGQLIAETRTDAKTQAVVYSHRYTYDALGNRTQKTLRDGTTIRYEYDAAGRLIKEVVKKPMLSSSDRVFNAFAAHVTFEEWRKADSMPQTIDYDYDDNGNLIRERFRGQIVSYEYDIEGRLVAVESPQGRKAYLLSPDGQRVGVVQDGQTVRLTYDGMNVNLELERLPTHYLMEPGIDQLLLKEQGGKRYYYHRGTANSVFQLSDESGNIVNMYDYDAFGEIIDADEQVENPYTFSARREEAAHVYYFRERLYSSRTGRFLSVDPIRASDANRSFRIGQLPRNTQNEGGPSPYERRLTPSGYVYTGRPLSTDGLDASKMNQGFHNAAMAQTVQASPLYQQRLIAATTGLDVTGYVYVGNSPSNHTDPTGEIIVWNPVSISATSGCIGSGCFTSGCLGSVCGGSGCIGSACTGSGCGGSACVVSGCGVSGCTLSMCGGSGCVGSACGGSGCIGSACGGSVCYGSACVGSGCGGSACTISGCGGSSCLGSFCGSSGCLISVCMDTTCEGSACARSGCSGSACASGTCS